MNQLKHLLIRKFIKAPGYIYGMRESFNWVYKDDEEKYVFSVVRGHKKETKLSLH